MARYCDKHRVVALNAKGLEQERRLIEDMSLSPVEQKRRLAARTERLRNLLGWISKLTGMNPTEDANESELSASTRGAPRTAPCARAPGHGIT